MGRFVAPVWPWSLKGYDPPYVPPLLDDLVAPSQDDAALEWEEIRPVRAHYGTVSQVAKKIASDEKEKPVLDERTLGKLLEAAYVLQEHNRELQERDLSLSLKREQMEAQDRSEQAFAATTPQPQTPKAVVTAADYTFTLAQIVETQHQIQVRHLDLQNAMTLVAERITQITRAGGSAIGILDGKKFRYRAATGTLTLPVGTEIAFDKALCLACLRTGQVFRCNDVNPEFLLDTDECRRRGILSMIAVPIFHEGIVAGGLELHYPIAHAFTEQDVHTCQLMAGLVTEALARDQEILGKPAAADASAAARPVEKLQASATIATRSSAKDSAANNSAARASASAGGKSGANLSAGANVGALAILCQKCGHRLLAKEKFCGHCGTPVGKMQDAAAGGGDNFPTAHKPMFEEPALTGESESLADSLEQQMPELFESVDIPTRRAEAAPQTSGVEIHAQFDDSAISALEDEEAQEPESAALVKTESTAPWSSAANARAFLEQLASTDRRGALTQLWNTRRGDVSLAIAAVVVVFAIGWGLLSGHSVQATQNSTGTVGTQQKSDANLSFFDRMLISLGLAEPPPPPENKGNPDTQVWVDLQTALYYCPADDLYGKTPKGRMTSQRSAQLDRFEPAYRKMCN